MMQLTAIDNSFPFDSALRRFAREHPTEGRFRFFEDRREHFSRSAPISFRGSSGIAIHDGSDIRALMSWSVLESTALNGSPERVGLLSGLRIAERSRREAAFLRGYRELEKWTANQSSRVVAFALENDQMSRILLAPGRTRLQTVDLGGYRTLLFPVMRRIGSPSDGRLCVRRAVPADLQAVNSFLETQQSRRAMFPTPRAIRLDSPEEGFRGLTLEHCLLALRGEKIVALSAVWDQSAYRRWVLTSYPLPEIGRRLWNGWAGISGRIRIPAANEAVPYRYLSLLSTAPGEESAARAVINRAISGCRADTPRPILVLGLHESDPLMETLRPAAERTLVSRMLELHFDNQPPCRRDGRVPFFEIGLL